MTYKQSLLAAAVAFVVVLGLGLAVGFTQQGDDDRGWFRGGDRDGFGMMGGSGRGDSGFGMMGGSGRGDSGFGMMGGSGFGMMGGRYGLAGDGAVDSLEAARAAAQRFADTLDLEVGEVMEFTDNYYAELETTDGDLATEVLVDPETGSVRIEFGPAMMWNAEYGMHRFSAGDTARVSPAEAEAIANEWLADHRDGETAGEAEAFPGYYTLHSMDGDEITGMLSVNASTGAVWYHSWHGDYVGMSES